MGRFGRHANLFKSELIRVKMTNENSHRRLNENGNGQKPKEIL